MVTVPQPGPPTLPVEALEFSADPNPFLEAARRQHPWLARFSQGYVVHGYQAACDLLADDDNLVPGFAGVVDFYGVRGSMWGRFMEEMILSQSGPTHTRLRASVVNAFTPRRAEQERAMMCRVITQLWSRPCDIRQSPRPIAPPRETSATGILRSTGAT